MNIRNVEALGTDELSVPLTEQEAFDIAWNGVLSQHGPALSGLTLGTPPVCMLRTASGKKDNLGWLIPDDKYRPDMEGRTLFSVRYLTGLDALFLAELRQAHDFAAYLFVEQFQSMYVKQMQYLARRFNLTVPPVPKNVSLGTVFLETVREALTAT